MAGAVLLHQSMPRPAGTCGFLAMGSDRMGHMIMSENF